MYLAIHKLILDKFPVLKGHPFFKTKLGIFLSIFVTQYLVFLTWLAFRVREFDDLIYSIEKYIIWDFATTKTIEIISSNKFAVFLIGLFILIHYISYKKSDLLETISNLKLRFWFLFLLVVMLLILLFYDANPDDFIYFRF